MLYGTFQTKGFPKSYKKLGEDKEKGPKTVTKTVTSCVTVRQKENKGKLLERISITLRQR